MKERHLVLRAMIAIMLSGCVAHPRPAAGEADRGAKPFAAKVREVLEAPTRLEILKIDPMPRQDGTVRASDFHEYPVLGRATLDDPAERRRLVDLVYRGVEHSDGNVAA